jgi:hypothetical protein
MEIIISIIALIIAISGWIVTYIFTIRAQNKNFINQVVNDARLEITSAIRDCQEWLNNVHFEILNSRCKVDLQEHGVSIDWPQKIAELTELFFSDRSSLKWIFRLEEYEILFPETAECRKDLVGRQNQIVEYLGSFLQELPSGFMEPEALEQRKKAIEKAQSNAEIVIEQLGLMEDLRIYLQNLCLSSFTGNKIPKRKPKKLSLPRLVRDKRGNLQISVPQDTKTN